MDQRCAARRSVPRSPPERVLRRLGPASELGQAAFAMVTGIAILLVLSAGILVSTADQHNPLVKNDVLQHLAYRGLEAGIDSYLTTINQNPNLINCNTSNTPGSPGYTGSATGSPGCSSTLLPALDTWTQVPNTSGDGSSVPEFYLWTNPQFCFSTAVGSTGNPNCTAPSTTAGATLAFIEEKVTGAAEIGNRYAYQSALAEFTPENGFLKNLWWSNYEATDPQIAANPNTAEADCTYDWNNNYYGPDTNNNNGSVPFPGSSYCSPVFFGPDDILYGPVYSNDSIYVDGDPSFGVPASSGQVAVPSTVTTHDPGCLFVDPDKNEWKSGSGSGSCNTASSQVHEYNSATSTFGAPFEPIPATDTQLGTLAAQGGCEYSGPTTIYLYVNNAVSPALTYMTVTSPDTPTSGSTDLDNASTNTSNCGVGTNAGIGVPVPSGTKGNGVIFAENTPSSQTCVSGANPFEDTSNGDSGGDAQPSGTAYYDVSGTSEDCEADVFVANASSALAGSGNTPGLSGNLTIASQNNIIIDGNLTYTTADCGSSFNSTFTGQCLYNSGATPNDTLGLIAYHFVEVDHPITPIVTTCSGSGFFYRCTTSGGNLEPACGTNGAPNAPNCNPNTGSGLVIDAAILALNDSFTVNNYTVGNPQGTLTVYGAIAQDWRGAVGLFNSGTDQVVSGYSKYYLWDSRLDYVTVPYYLNPGTPSWGLTSTGVLQNATNPCSGSLPYPWPQTTGTTPTCLATLPPSLPV
jgi:hypothetical protein